LFFLRTQREAAVSGAAAAARCADSCAAEARTDTTGIIGAPACRVRAGAQDAATPSVQLLLHNAIRTA
jgi:hypothetical protein